MALTADQSAILELLLSGQGFAELGELLGLDEGEVRLRAREALGELGGADPDRNVALSAYLLGHADPITRADAVRHLRQDPADRELAEEIVARLREIEPGARLPELPALAGAPRRAPRPPRPAGTGDLRSRIASLGAPESRRTLYAALGGGALILVAIVLAVSGVLGGDDESSTAASDTTAGTDSAQGEVERIPLEPVGGGDASGEGVVGITTGDQPYLDLTLENLEPAPQGQVYVVWFLFDERTGYPLSPIAPDQQGSFEDRFAIPTPAISVLARMRFLNVSLAPVREVQGAIQRAVENNQIVIEKPGRTVLQNTQPLPAPGAQADEAAGLEGLGGQGGAGALPGAGGAAGGGGTGGGGANGG